MSSNSQSLFSLEAYGLLCQLPAVQHGDDEILFQRDQDHIVVRLKSWSTFWERVWGGATSIQDIHQLAHVSLQQGLVGVSEGSKAKIQVALDAINAVVSSSHADLVPLSLPQSHPHVRVQLPVRGLQNPINKCYANASITTLCASDRFQELMLSQPRMSDASIYLRLVFQALQTPGAAVSHYVRPMNDFISSMVESFPALRATVSLGVRPAEDPTGGFSQQDAAEFLGRVLARTIGDGFIEYREIVERRAPQHTRLTESISLSSIFIPAVDGRGPGNAHLEHTNIFQVTFEELGECALEDYFFGIEGKEQIQVSAIGPHGMAGRLKGKRPEGVPDIPVVRRRIFTRSPLFLPVQIARFVTKPIRGADGSIQSIEKIKIVEPVDLPWQIALPMEKGPPVPFILRGVISHLGTSIDQGHYIGYVPDYTSPPTATGMPSMWRVYNDGSPVAELPWAQLVEAVTTTCYLLLYDEQ